MNFQPEGFWKNLNNYNTNPALLDTLTGEEVSYSQLDTESDLISQKLLLPKTPLMLGFFPSASSTAA